MRVLILGASGMLGHVVVQTFAQQPDRYEVFAATRSLDLRARFPELSHIQSITGIDAEKPDELLNLFTRIRPDCVVNCIGLVKQNEAVHDPLLALPINALLPHRLARLSSLVGARLIHISTDCVFQGTRGGYTEDDVSDATDLYGKSKYLGEVDMSNAITLRTSMVGHELQGAQGLVEWFLSQQHRVSGYRKSIFSGLPTTELSRVIRDYVLPNPKLSGVFHVATDPISKFDLLSLVAKVYGRDIVIEPDDAVRIDRSLDGSRFRSATGYKASPWPELIAQMHAHYKSGNC